MNNKKCYSCAKKISVIGLWTSAFLAMFKGIVGILTHSRALIASALYSANDVISSIAVLIGLKLSDRPIDEEHPYGHGNIEYIVSVFTSLLILAGTVYLLYDSVNIIFKGEQKAPHWAAFGAAVISGITNEMIYRYNLCAVNHINSPAIHAHAKHHRADAISSVAVVVAIIVGKFGFYSIDAFVAVFETVHLTHISIDILHKGSIGLMDRSLDHGVVDVIRRIVSSMHIVKEIKNIRTRQIGRGFWVDLDISLPVDISIVQANKVSKKLKETLIKKIKYLENVNIVFV